MRLALDRLPFSSDQPQLRITSLANPWQSDMQVPSLKDRTLSLALPTPIDYATPVGFLMRFHAVLFLTSPPLGCKPDEPGRNVTDLTEANDAIVVVGDRFAGFTDGHTTLTTSQALVRIRKHAEDPMNSDQICITIMWGQGVSPYEHDLVAAEIQRQTVNARFSVEPHPLKLAGRSLVNKYREANVLVANLEKHAPRECRALLRVHNDNEIILDHQTGKHIQGMVAIEAARQMFLASTQQFFLPNEPSTERYFVINEMRTKFRSFLFPLKADLHFKINSLDNSQPDALRFVGEITILQADKTVTETTVDFTAFAAPKIEAIESKKASVVTRILSAQPEPSLS